MDTLIILLWIKWTEMGEIKHKDFIDAVPIVPCQKPSWIMGLSIYWERRTEIPLISLAAKGPLARIQNRQSLYRYKKLLTIPRLITSWYPLLIIIMSFLLIDSSQKPKLEKIHGILIILFYVGPSSPQLQTLFFWY